MAVRNTLVKRQSDDPLKITFRAGNNDVTLGPETVKKYLVSGDASKVTNQEIVMFINLCKFQGLNPFLREAYLIKYGSQPATLVVGKNAFEKRASRCEKYKGFDAGVIVYVPGAGLEERTGTIVLDDEKLIGGWAEVYVDGFEKPVKVSVSFEEYVGRKSDGSINSQWSAKPATMIRKVAKVQALREAFPEDFEGMYSAEESGVSEPLSEIPVTASETEMASESEITDFAELLEENE